ncbi:unnamed protein product [Adineta ricciae]|uniref:Uncharacterized protein n=1 Tax=Adineta ricciae TaxID=249248 RepID=A0A816B2B3_ADIRI|nr:unnamed protein product [Adineta ricciae]CAF1603819.1 unnamed protein product [Adineta ricciae]
MIVYSKTADPIFPFRSNNPILGSHRIPSDPIQNFIRSYRNSTVSDPIGSHVGSRQIRNMDFLDFLKSDSNAIPFPGIRSDFVEWSDPIEIDPENSSLLWRSVSSCQISR